tara:strand:+ start:4137 stop:4364 length:228 start_codon:yes stop_codon:yes gene_type:complete
MTYAILKTELAARNLKRYMVQISDERIMNVKTSGTATQSDIDTLIDKILKEEKEEEEKIAQEKKDAEYAATNGDS